jgi:hypothetical protein
MYAYVFQVILSFLPSIFLSVRISLRFHSRKETVKQNSMKERARESEVSGGMDESAEYSM